MADIYQEIWDADQGHAGLKAIRPTTPITPALSSHGYIVVNENGAAGANQRVIESVVIPPKKLGNCSITPRSARGPAALVAGVD